MPPYPRDRRNPGAGEAPTKEIGKVVQGILGDLPQPGVAAILLFDAVGCADQIGQHSACFALGVGLRSAGEAGDIVDALAGVPYPERTIGTCSCQEAPAGRK
jgi:hypothetical protein